MIHKLETGDLQYVECSIHILPYYVGDADSLKIVTGNKASGFKRPEIVLPLLTGTSPDSIKSMTEIPIKFEI